MDKEKQIEKIASILMDKCDRELDCSKKADCDMCRAELLVEKGYRKASDVAREIFEEIEKTLKECLWFLKNHPSNYPSMDRTKINVYKDNLQYIAELKKKYTEEK